MRVTIFFAENSIYKNVFSYFDLSLQYFGLDSSGLALDYPLYRAPLLVAESVPLEHHLWCRAIGGKTALTKTRLSASAKLHSIVSKIQKLHLVPIQSREVFGIRCTVSRANPPEFTAITGIPKSSKSRRHSCY